MKNLTVVEAAILKEGCILLFTWNVTLTLWHLTL